MSLRSLSSLLAELKTILKAEKVPVSALLEGLHERGFGAALLIFSLPMALPFPKPPGISTLFGLPLLALAIQQAFGRRTIWMPKFILSRTISGPGMMKMTEKSIPWVQKAEKIIKPRLEWVTQGVFSHLIGIAGAIMALCIAIPLPGSNTVPGMGIALMSAGVMMRDGITVLIGGIIGLGWVFFLAWAYLTLGSGGLDALQSLL